MGVTSRNAALTVVMALVVVAGKADNTHSEGPHGGCIIESRPSLALLRPSGVSHALRGALKHGRRIRRVAEPCAPNSKRLSEIGSHETPGGEKRRTAYERGAKKLWRRSFVSIGVLLERLLDKRRPLRRGEAPANEGGFDSMTV